jgi:hypothetical protein
MGDVVDIDAERWQRRKAEIAIEVARASMTPPPAAKTYEQNRQELVDALESIQRLSGRRSFAPPDGAA